MWRIFEKDLERNHKHVVMVCSVRQILWRMGLPQSFESLGMYRYRHHTVYIFVGEFEARGSIEKQGPLIPSKAHDSTPSFDLQEVSVWDPPKNLNQYRILQRSIGFEFKKRI